MPQAGAGTPWGSTGRDVVTAEAVRLDLEPVGVGSRGIAVIIDLLLLLALDIALGIGLGTVLSGLPQYLTIAIVGLMVLFNLFGYHLLFELAWRGQTPGKRQQNLRVLMVDGSLPRTSAIVVRNLVRIVDFLPSAYAIGVITMLVSPRWQRLGDLAAGTIVVRQRRPGAAVAAVDAVDLPPWADALDVSAVGDREYGLARGWLARRDSLAPEPSRDLARQVAAVLRQRVEGIPPGVPDDALVLAVVTLVQRRSR